MLGYAGSRGKNLWRSNDVNTAAPTTLADGTVFIPAGTPRPNTGFSTIELKSSDGDSWYNALIVDVRRRFSAGFSIQSSYTLSKSEDTTQASTFFSDATNGTTTAFPEYIAGYNKGPVGLRHPAQLGAELHRGPARRVDGLGGDARAAGRRPASG